MANPTNPPDTEAGARWLDDLAAEVVTYHRVTTRDGDQVITRLGAGYAVAAYGAYGPVQAVTGREVATGFSYDPTDVGPDLRGE